MIRIAPATHGCLSRIDHSGGRISGRRSARLAFRANPSIVMTAIVALGICTMAFAQRQAQYSWWDRSPEEKYGHYWIKSDLPAEQVRAIASHLNMMYGQYARLLAFVPVRVEEKLNVLAFKSRDDYQL